jgi:hypothetical protein
VKSGWFAAATAIGNRIRLEVRAVTVDTDLNVRGKAKVEQNNALASKRARQS